MLRAHIPVWRGITDPQRKVCRQQVNSLIHQQVQVYIYSTEHPAKLLKYLFKNFNDFLGVSTVFGSSKLISVNEKEGKSFFVEE